MGWKNPLWTKSSVSSEFLSEFKKNLQYVKYLLFTFAAIPAWLIFRYYLEIKYLPHFKLDQLISLFGMVFVASLLMYMFFNAFFMFFAMLLSEVMPKSLSNDSKLRILTRILKAGVFIHFFFIAISILVLIVCEGALFGYLIIHTLIFASLAVAIWVYFTKPLLSNWPMRNIGFLLISYAVISFLILYFSLSGGFEIVAQWGERSDFAEISNFLLASLSFIALFFLLIKVNAKIISSDVENSVVEALIGVVFVFGSLVGFGVDRPLSESFFKLLKAGSFYGNVSIVDGKSCTFLSRHFNNKEQQSSNKGNSAGNQAKAQLFPTTESCLLKQTLILSRFGSEILLRIDKSTSFVSVLPQGNVVSTDSVKFQEPTNRNLIIPKGLVSSITYIP